MVKLIDYDDPYALSQGGTCGIEGTIYRRWFIYAYGTQVPLRVVVLQMEHWEEGMPGKEWNLFLDEKTLIPLNALENLDIVIPILMVIARK